MAQLNFIRDAAGNLVGAQSDGKMPGDRVADELTAIRELFAGLLGSLTQSLAKAAATPPATAADLEGFRKSIVASFDAAATPIVAKLEQQEQDRQRRAYRSNLEGRFASYFKQKGELFGVVTVETTWKTDTDVDVVLRNRMGAVIPTHYFLPKDGKLNC